MPNRPPKNTPKYPSIDLKDYQLPDTDEEFLERLKDPVFRICNIYKIQTKEGGDPVKFVPNWAQRVVLYYVFILGRRRIAIPKARQLGFSTLIAIIALDKAYWSNGQQCSIVDQSRDDAEEKLDKVSFAFANLDPALREGAGVVTDKNSEIAWSNGSSVSAGKNARGGTNQLVHISELGPIAYEDLRRAEEIVSGAIPSASGKDALVFVESTYKGGKAGHWYKIIKAGMSVADEHRTNRDWTVLFFEWFLEPNYTLDGPIERVDAEHMRYFDKLEEDHGIKLTDGQKLWYYVEKTTAQGVLMLREYPSTMAEMWSVRDDGQIYAPFIDKAREQGRINNNIRWYAELPVYAVFDIGAAKNTKCLIFQPVGDRINYLEGKSGGLEMDTPHDWGKWLTDKPYRYGGIFLPHDGEAVWHPILRKMGLQALAPCLPRPMDVWDNIKLAQMNFQRCEFYEEGLLEMEGEDDVGLIGSAEAYHCALERDGQTVKEVPVHNWASHFCTCFGYSHQAMDLGMLVDRSAIQAHQGPPVKPKVRMRRRGR